MTTTLKSVTSNSDTERANHILQLTKAYQADQQVKYLHLQTELDLLLQEVQTLKQGKASSKTVPFSLSQRSETRC